MASRLGTLVKHIMSQPVIFATPTQTLDHVLRVLLTKRIHRLPVLAENGDKLVGIITERDLRLVSSSPFLGYKPDKLVHELAKHKVGEVMNHTVVTVQEDEPIVDAVKLMRVANVGGLPVLNAEGKVVGMCTTTDLIDHLIRILEPEPGKATEVNNKN